MLENLAKCSKHVLLSTKIFKYIPGVESPLGEYSLAYLLDSTECNGDNTNYWIFSETGLRRLVERCGFEIVLFDVANPRTRPVESKTGPPELPGLIGAVNVKVFVP